jgi:hypothetical protein
MELSAYRVLGPRIYINARNVVEQQFVVFILSLTEVKCRIITTKRGTRLYKVYEQQ